MQTSSIENDTLKKKEREYMQTSSMDYLGPRIENINILDKKEVYELIKRYQEGDIEAGKKLVKHNIKHVLKIALYYMRRFNVDYDELIGYGIMGLYRAMQKFDPNRGFTFATYSHHWIRQRMIRNCLWRYDLVNTRDIKNGKQRFKFKSLDDTEVWKGRECCKLITHDSHKNIFVRRTIKKYIDNIPNKRTRSIMKYKFGLIGKTENMGLREIGNIHNLSGERVRQIIEQEIRKMRQNNKLRELNGWEPIYEKKK